ncbi:hypothetical protein Cgig2_030713 [Carnegiea gigantea]|uniref:Uncharacterized protein n=1 Tax=Carnegiea gigantea TaxID=171969 RepID=A0A9Q1K7C3_9CARY|nr:hypothetical protein Cgig2_030713 [Carnegiea gigantea]
MAVLLCKKVEREMTNKLLVSERAKCGSDKPQTRLRLEGKISELSDDDEISITSDDMDKHKQGIQKWENGVGERIEQKLSDTYKKMDCVAAMESYNLALGEYSVELTNNRKLVCHALAVMTKANLSVYDYMHPIYKMETNITSTISKQVTWRKLMTGQGLWLVEKSLMKSTTNAYYP